MGRTGENIYKRKDGRWEARYILFYNCNGKAKYKYIYAKTYSEVKAKLLKAQFEDSFHAMSKVDNSCKSYESWLWEWLSTKRSSVKESTYIRYNNMIRNHIIPELGKYPIDKVGTSLMENFIQNKLRSGRLDGRGGLSSKTTADILIIIKESFKYAQETGVHTVCRFDRIIFRKSLKQMRVLSTDEQKGLLSVILNNIDCYKLGVFICLFTGIRIGELCALQWKNISFSEKILRVERTMQRIPKEDRDTLQKTKIIITEPKSIASIRAIPLPDFIIEILKPFASSPDSYVLSGKNGDFTEPRTMQNKFKSYLKEGKIKDANFHSLRHTFATRCVEAGFDAKTLSELLGHSSVKITLDRYVHSSMQLKRNNMEKLSLSL